MVKKVRLWQLILNRKEDKDMANQTTAWGTVFITAPDEKSLIDFVYLKILSEKNAEYTTEFDELPEYTIHTEETFARSVVEKAIREESDFMESEDGVSVELAFNGIGRWTFAQNAEWFFEIPLVESEYETPEAQELAKRVSTLKLKAQFDCEEEEPGAWYSHDKYYVVWEDGESRMKGRNLEYGDAPDYNE